MVFLRLDELNSLEILGLAKYKPLITLSEKRITKAARERLREEYGNVVVEVSCTVDLCKDVWRGRCVIGGIERSYEIIECK